MNSWKVLRTEERKICFANRQLFHYERMAQKRIVKDTYSQEWKWFVENTKRVVYTSVKPRMVSARAESDEILFMLDVIHLRAVERLGSFKVVAHTAIF